MCGTGGVMVVSRVASCGLGGVVERGSQSGGAKSQGLDGAHGILWDQNDAIPRGRVARISSLVDVCQAN